jgi:ribosome modulation factor
MRPRIARYRLRRVLENQKRALAAKNAPAPEVEIADPYLLEAEDDEQPQRPLLSLYTKARSPWRHHKSHPVRKSFRAGMLAAICHHPREDCPYAGAIRQQQKDFRTRRKETGAKHASDLRQAWLAGWELQTEAMKEEKR